MRSPLGSLSVLVLLFTIPLANAATAQTDVEVNAAIEFDFSTPGARSLSLGGAFVALADDATAAFTNPAGLVQLTRPEVSVEGRRREFTTTFTDSGSTRIGPDGTSELVDGTSASSTNSLSFASYVYPKGKWAIGLYYHQLANFETAFSTIGASLEPTTFQLLPTRASLDLEIEALGIATAFKLTEKLSLGIGVQSFRFKLNSLTERFQFPRESSSAPVNSQTIDGDDNGVSVNVGILWSVSKSISIGAALRRGTSFEIIETCIGCSSLTPSPVRADFNVPDTASIGLAIRLSEKSTITVEYDRITYSDLTESVPPFVSSMVVAENLETDDADELRVGFEYLFSSKNPIGIRFGAWYDPDHRTRLDLTLEEAVALDELGDFALFRPGDDIVHYTFGVGISIGEHFQIDAGIDLSERVDTGSLSAVFRF